MDRDAYTQNQLPGVSPVTQALFTLQAIVDSSNDAIIGKTLEGEIVSWNPAAEVIYGYSPEEAIGRHIDFLAPPGVKDQTVSLLEEIKLGHPISHFETVHLRKDGKKISVSLTLSPIRDQTGNVVAASTISRDISVQKRTQEDLHLLNRELERRVQERTEALSRANESLKAQIAERLHTEEQLRVARHAAEAANQAKSQFIANMSHEMRTPLAAILGYAEMMYDSRQTVTERLNCIGRIRHNLKSLTELVDDILDLSKVEAGKTEICPVTFSLLPELAETFSLLESQAWKKRLSFDLVFEPPIPETITTDASRFRQILNNIISNAIKFTERGGVSVTAKLTPKAEGKPGHTLAFIVTDTGCGIAPAQIESLFQPFVQGDGSLTRAFGGTGLGLALSRRLARTLGGDVVLTKTQPERGSTFCITIDPGPLESTRMLNKVEREDLAVRQPSPPPRSARKLEGMRVLLVEDAPDIQILVSHFLKRSGAYVEVADNGYDAIKKARNGRYDLILMDIQMPVLNGYEATAQLHRDGFKSPIVALTAHAMKGVREKCLQAGCDDYLTKPINATALLDLIGRYYQRSRELAAH